MHWIARYVIPWSFALIGLLVLANGVVMYRDVATLRQQARWVTHNRAVVDQVKLVRAIFAAVEDEQPEQPRVVAGAVGARRALLTQVEELRRLTAADTRQQLSLHALSGASGKLCAIIALLHRWEVRLCEPQSAPEPLARKNIRS